MEELLELTGSGSSTEILIYETQRQGVRERESSVASTNGSQGLNARLSVPSTAAAVAT